jgi:4'-phosphopantetheinyl transferase
MPALPCAEQEPHLLSAYRALLSPAELAAAEGGAAAAEGVREERLLSKALARVTLARYARLPPAALRFGRNAHGKPWLSAPLLDGLAAPALAPRLCFSVAHAPGALLCAVSLDADVGCDVEEASRGNAAVAQRLARRYFTPAEVAALDALPPGEPRRRRFLHLWTLKEAYVKALGRGIAHAPLNSFQLALHDDDDDAAAGLRGDVPMRVGLQHLGAPHAVAPRGDEAVVGDALRSAAAAHQPGAWRFALLQLCADGRAAAGSSSADSAGGGHVAAVCVGAVGGADAPPLVLRCWRTVPLSWDAHATPAQLATLAFSAQ